MKDMEQRLAEDLRYLENSLDENTANELAERRRQALEAPPTPLLRALWNKHWVMPSMGAALASALLLAVFLSPMSPSGSKSKAASTEVQLSERIELYENLEFYSWLAESEANERS